MNNEIKNDLQKDLTPIPLTQMFIECSQEWDETDDMEWVADGWLYLQNEKFDFEKYYEHYENTDTDKHYHPIKSIWKLKSEYHNDLLKVPENRIFFNVLTEQEKNRLKYVNALIGAKPNLSDDIFSNIEEIDEKENKSKNTIYINPNYTRDTNNKLIDQRNMIDKIINTAQYLANIEIPDFLILSSENINNPEVVKEAKKFLNIKE